MINPAELDTRLLSHAARVDSVDRFGAMLPVKHRANNGPGSFVLQLNRWLALWVTRRPRPTIRGSAA